MKSKFIISGLVVFVFLIILQIILGSSNGRNHAKLNQIFTKLEEIEENASIIVEVNSMTNRDEIVYGEVDFVISDIFVTRVFKGSEIKENSLIKILQTKVNEDPLLDKDKKYLLFLNKYDGPVAENVYVVHGMYQGQFLIEDDRIVKNDMSKVAVESESYSQYISKFDSENDLEPTSFTAEQLNNLPGVSINYLQFNNSSNTIEYELINSTNDTIYYGDGVILEKNIKEKWYKIPYSGDVGFLPILNYLSPLDSTEIRLPMGAWKTVISGDYRIIQDVSKKDGSNIQYPISANFTIDK